MDETGTWKDLFASAGYTAQSSYAPHGLVAFAISPDGKTLAVGGADDNLHLIAADTGTDRRLRHFVFPPPGRVTGELVPVAHFARLLLIAGDFDADAGLLAQRVQAAPADLVQKDTPPCADRSAIEHVALLVGDGASEVSLRSEPFPEESLPFGRPYVDPRTAAFLSAGVGEAVGFCNHAQVHARSVGHMKRP
jgi:hypothetical protein